MPLCRPTRLRDAVPSLTAALLAAALAGHTYAADGGSGSAPPQGSRAEAATRDTWSSIPTPAGRGLRTLIVRPASGATAATVIVVHENRGLTLQERSFAEELAHTGCFVIVPDFLSETGPNGGASESFESTGAARDALHNLTAAQVIADLDAIVDFARRQSARGAKVVLLGFGWGGGQVFRYAAEKSGIDAAVVFYGPAPNDEHLQEIAVPVYAFYGENDLPITEEVSKLRIRMKELDKRFQAVIYPGAGHAFMRTGEATDARPADRTACEQAQVRLRDILSAL